MLYYSISRLYWNRNPDSALLMGQKALEISRRSKFEKGIALSLLTQGVAYSSKGDYPEALNCHLQALRISEKLGLDGLTGDNYSNIGIVYNDMGEYSKALDYFERALTTARKRGVKPAIAALLVNIAEVHKKRNDFDSAIVYNTIALKITEEIRDSLTMSITLLNIGDNYNKKKQPGKALSYLLTSLHISEKIRDAEGIAWSNNSLAETDQLSGRYAESISYAGKGLQQALALGMGELAKESYHILYSDYEALGDFKTALAERNREIALNDSLHSLEKDKEIKGLQSDYELEKKQHQIDLLNKDKVIQQSEIARDRIKVYLFVGLALLLGLWAFFLVRSNFFKQRLNQLLESRNQEIGNQNQQLEDLNMVKNKLLSIIGHDLRSPIGTLKGFVDLLKQSRLSEEQIHYFSKKMSESLEGTTRLLDNLLFWAKSQMEGIQINAQHFDLGPVIGQNKRLAQSRADEKNIALITDEAELPVMVYADEIMVDMVIRNLVENAVKFCRAGDAVRISAVIGKNGASVTIKDTGQGIPAENQDKIFKSVSYSTAGTSREKGSGLGLSLCKELIEKNGGKIWFESEPGVGTSFTFTLPVSDTRGDSR
jgi:two-component system sensor histidine kinase/response regulator